MESIPTTRDFSESDQIDLESAYSLVYNELRRLAAYYMRQERSNHTLQPTALVNEAYLRLVKQENQIYLNRTQFIALAANMMRRILVNHAVHRNRQKREGEFIKVTLDRAVDVLQDKELDLLILDSVLKRLSKTDEDAARVFELRFFGGLTVEESAEVMSSSPATVKRDWAFAKAYIQRELFD